MAQGAHEAPEQDADGTDDMDDAAAMPDGDLRHVTLAGGPGRLDSRLAACCPDLSRTRIQALIRESHVTLDGQTVTDPSHRVKPGLVIALQIPPPLAAHPVGEAIALTILYEDAELIVIDKPAGMAVHPGPGVPGGTLVNALLHHCAGELSGVGGIMRPGIVHRLDKDTSGVMLAAKTGPAHEDLSRQFAERRVKRRYRAFCRGCPKPDEGTITGNIGRHPRQRKRMAVRPAGEGKTALTSYRTEQCFAGRAAEISCRLGTGRTHQIRVHLAHIGHPLIGDPVYGGRGAAALLSRQALHAAELGFCHPRSGEKMAFASELPADLMALRRQLAEEV